MYLNVRKIKLIIITIAIAILANASLSTAYAKEVIPVRVSHHKNFSRVVFDLPRLVKYTAKTEDRRIHLDFDIEARAVFSVLSTPFIKNIVQLKKNKEKLSVTIVSRKKMIVKKYPQQKNLVIDIYTSPKLIKETIKPAPQTILSSSLKKDITSIEALKKAVQSLLPSSEKKMAEVEIETKTKTDTKAKQKKAEIKKKLAPPKKKRLKFKKRDKKPQLREDNYYTKNTTTIRLSFLETTNLAVMQRAGLLWLITDSTSIMSLPVIKGPLAKFILPPKVIRLDNGTAYAYKLPLKLYPHIEKKHLMWEVTLKTTPTKQVDNIDFKMIANRFGIIKKIGIPLKGAYKIIEFEDPIVGDKLYIAPTNDSTQRISNSNFNSDFEIRPSDLGLIIRPLRDDLVVYSVEDFVFVTSQLNMNITPQNMGAPILIDDNITMENKNIDELRIFDFPKWRKKGVLFLQQNKTEIQNEIGLEEDKEKRTGLMMRLARLYFANHHGHEALGVLSLISQNNPEILQHPDFMAIRGAANAISGRYQEAIKDFSFPPIQHNPEVKLWRGFAAAKAEQWRMADRTFPRDNRILLRYPESMAIPFTIYMAESFLHLGHKKEAKNLLDTINTNSSNLNIQHRSAISYLRGEIARQDKKFEQAEKLWTPIAEGKDRLYHTKASLSLTRLLHQQKKITAQEAVERIETLRFAWRGDALEAEILRNLGKLKAKNETVLAGLQDMKNAVDTAERLRIDSEYIVNEMSDIFYEFFISKDKKQTSTIEAISIYNGFKTLLPDGEKGAAVNLRFADYLINADLLSDAATVLENHIPRSTSDKTTAQLGAKLAKVYLLNNKPNRALKALAKTIVEKAHSDIIKERVILNAQAHTQLKDYTIAIKLLNKSRSKEALLLKANIYWKQKQWRQAALTLEALINKNKLIKDSKRNNTLVNMAVAWKLAGNTKKLRSVKDKYGEIMATTKYADIFKVVTRSGGASKLSDRKTTLKIAEEADIFNDFLKSYKSIDKDDN